MSDDLTSVPITVMPANSTALGPLDPLTQLASDIDARFVAGKAARLAQFGGLDTRITAVEARPNLTTRVVALEARPQVPDLSTRVSALEAVPAAPDLTSRVVTLESRPVLTDRVTALEARPYGPDLTTRVVALEARAIVPDLTTRVVALEARPTYTTATLAAAGVIKANITQIARTTTPVSVNVAGGVILGASLLPSVSVTVAGVAVGDFVQAAFAAAPPTGLTISAAQATAANTVLVTFAATQAVTLTAGAQSLNFCWTR